MRRVRRSTSAVAAAASLRMRGSSAVSSIASSRSLTPVSGVRRWCEASAATRWARPIMSPRRPAVELRAAATSRTSFGPRSSCARRSRSSGRTRATSATSSRGAAIDRARSQAMRPAAMMTAMTKTESHSCVRRTASLTMVSGRESRTAATTRSSLMTGAATYLRSAPSVSEKRTLDVSEPPSALWTSGRSKERSRPELSLSATSTSESSTTTTRPPACAEMSSTVAGQAESGCDERTDAAARVSTSSWETKAAR